MDDGPSRVRQRVESVLADVVALRHDLHRVPEIACKEVETSRRVRSELAKLPLDVLDPFLETDVVALLRGAHDGPNVTLRADMDALPIHEATDVAYRSQRPGMMHACGHDGHTAMLVGAARVLCGLRDRLHGTVRFVFQPGEEGVATARDLVAAGAIDDPLPKCCVALHAWPGMPVGTIGSMAGPALAAADFYGITVKGRGGHGAMPHLACNPVPVAARIVGALEGIPSGSIAATTPVVVNTCVLHAGSASNVVPGEALIEGTVRYFDEQLAQRLPELIKRVAAGICTAAGAECDCAYRYEYPPTVNSEEVVETGREVAVEQLGAERWVPQTLPVMGAEDFAYFLMKAPGAMFRLGMGETAPLHNARFDFSDDALGSGVQFLAATALRVLGQAGHA